MGDVGAGMENEKAVWIAADDGEDGGGDAVEVVTLPHGTADAVVLNVEEKSCVVGESADVLRSMAGGGIGGGVRRFQSTGDVD